MDNNPTRDLHNFRLFTLTNNNTVKYGLPSVLVPGLHLCVRESKFGRQFHPVLNTEVFLSLEALLQGVELVVGEGCTSFTLFLARRG